MFWRILMKKLKFVVPILLLCVGVLITVYPFVCNLWNNSHQSQVIYKYDHESKALNQNENKRCFLEAEKYNKKLSKLKCPLVEYAKLKGYSEILNVSGDSVIGYIKIDSINVCLPIYHGTSPKVLAVGCGHLKGTSFPIGEKGTHAVLTAHCGYPKAKLFTDLNKLKIGDLFTVDVLDRKLTYEVDQIKIVKPDEIGELAIKKNKDYCTLMACTPYGINSHRLLVRGARIS